MAENNKNLDTLLNKVMEDTGMSVAEEMLMLQRQRQIKTENKPVAQMTDSEKEMFAEMQQEYIQIIVFVQSRNFCCTYIVINFNISFKAKP